MGQYIASKLLLFLLNEFNISKHAVSLEFLSQFRYIRMTVNFESDFVKLSEYL